MSSFPPTTFVTARPFAPKPLAQSASASVSLRVIVAPPGTAIAFTIGAALNTLKSVCFARSPMSASGMSYRRSGRSLPYFVTASS